VSSVDSPERGPVRLRSPRHRVSRKAVAYWTVGALIGWLIATGIQLLLLLAVGLHWPHYTLIATAVLGPLHVLVMPTWRFRVHRWEATDKAVFTQAGWIKQEWRIAPISRLQTIDVARGPLEQIFGLAKVTITTASAGGPIHIHGLDHAVALTLVDELTTTTQATTGDAT
jgi:membrane protein YdbS with pleckstrin-like domain